MVNAAKDSTELVAKLRSYHNAAQNAPIGDPKKILLRYGLDLLNGQVRDNVAAGVSRGVRPRPIPVARRSSGRRDCPVRSP